MRVVAATNRRLDDEWARGTSGRTCTSVSTSSRSTSPPLREHLDDLPALVAYLAERVRPRQAAMFTPAALDALTAYAWPGNVRELANLVERLSILSGPTVDAHDVRAVLREGPPPPAAITASGRPLDDALDDFERSLIAAALAQARGNVAEAARVLRTDRANLYRRMRRLGLDKRDE